MLLLNVKFCTAIANVSASSRGSKTITQLAYQVRSRVISRFNRSISKVLQKLPKYVNDTIVTTFFVLLSTV